MKNKGVTIIYGDVAPGAKEDFAPTSSESKFDTLWQLQNNKLGVENYANPCEKYQTILDGTAEALPSDVENATVGLWSENLSEEDGYFAGPIVHSLKSSGQYTSQGLTFTFDTLNDIYCTELNIEWKRNGVKLHEEEFFPDSAQYFCQRFIENYDELNITFYRINMPFNRLKLSVIDYGRGTEFYGDELRNVKLIQEIDPISSEISINTADFTLDSKSGDNYLFQKKQPLSVYFNGELKATTFVKSAKRQAKFLWQVQSEDYIGLLDSIPYYGGIYTNAYAVNIIEDIFSIAKIPYTVESDFSDVRVTGHIPYTTCRDALMQVAFAIQAVVDTSNADRVKIYALETDVKQTIPLNRIMQGQNFSDDETVTGVEVTAHAYKPISETLEAYDASESGTGTDIFVKFSEPLHSLTITNGTIVSRGTNYAVINANAGCVLMGKKYDHNTQTKRKHNPLVLASEIEKIVAVENATLVSVNNIDNVLEK